MISLVKVKATEVANRYKNFKKKAKPLKNSMKTAGSTMVHVSLTPNLSSKGQKAMNKYLNIVHDIINNSIINDINQADDQFNKLINSFKNEVDNDSSAVLDSSYIKDVSTKFSNKAGILLDAINECNKGVYTANRIVNLSLIDCNKSLESLRAVYKSVDKTVEKLERFNRKKLLKS